MATPIVYTLAGSWSIPDTYVLPQPTNQMLNIAVGGITGGNWLVATLGWREVPQLPMTVSVGDDAGNLWTPIVTSPSVAPVTQPFLLNQNYDFHTGTTAPWTVTHGTLTASTTKTYGNNAYAGRVVNSGTDATVSITSGTASIQGFSPNLVTGSAYVWYTSGTATAHVDLNWYTSGGTPISTTTGPVTTVAAGTWTNLTNVSAPPSGAAYAAVTVSTGGTPSAANIWYVSTAGVATTQTLNTDAAFTLSMLSTYWTPTNATIAATTAQTYNNQPAIAISPTGSAPQVTVQTATAYLVAITAGQYYTGSVFAYAPAGYFYINAYISWYDQTKTLISTTTSTNTYVPPGQWAQALVSAQAPATAAYAALGLSIPGTPQPWNVLYAAQATLTPMQGYSSVARAAIWAAPNALSSTTQVSIAPLGQATAVTAQIWQVSGMPSWLEVDTVAANQASQSSSSRLTLTPSQNDFVIATCTASLSQQWTLDRDALNGWQPLRITESTTNNTTTEGDLFTVSTGVITSGATTPTFYAVNPLNNNPVFAASVSGWSVNNATLVSSSAFAWPSNAIDTRLTSTRSALCTPNGTSPANSVFTALSSAPAITPGLVYQGDAYLYSPPGWSNYTLSLLWLNSSRVQISSTVSATFTVPAATWTNTTVAGTAPTGAAYAAIAINQNGTPPTSATTYIGRGTLTQATNNGLGLAQVAAAFRLTPRNQPATINANWPNLRLEAAFGYPSSTPPDQLQYVDISNRVLSVTLKRGRQYELNSLSAGEADFVLRNDDGFLTPSNPAGPYTILSYTPIRLTALQGGKVYPLFVGYMERWPETWATPHWGEINAVGVDAWAMFVGISPSVVKGERLADYPAGYWPCGDGASSTTAINIGLSGNSTPLTVKQSPAGAGSSAASFGDSTLKLVGDTGTNWVLNGLLSSQGSQGFSLVYDGPPLPPINQGVCVTWWMYIKYPGGPITTQTRNAIFTAVGSAGPIIQVWMDTATAIHVTTWNTAGTQTDHSSSTFGYANQYMPMMLNFSNAGYTLYIGNSEVLTGTDTMVSYWSHFSFCGRYDLYAYGNFADMAISHVAVYPRQLGFSRLVTYNYTGINGLAGDYGDWRVSRLMSYMLWTVPHRVYYDTSTSQLAGADDISGKDFGSAINDVATTERALLYVDKAGYLTYRTRDHSLDRGIQATFGENTAAGEIPYLVDVSLDYDPQYVYNDFQVTHKGTPKQGATSTSSPIIYTKNLASINQYGDRGQQLTSYFNSIQQSVDLANWLVNQYSQPQPRVQSVTFSPASNPAAFATLLELDIGDRVLFNRRPVGASQISLDVTVIGVHHNIDYKSGKWDISYDLMPTVISSLAVKTLTLNDPVLGLLNSTNVIGW
jgi:hypothetical protein